MKASDILFTRSEIEEFLFDEAALLDEWRLEEWLALMAPDARYLVPPLDAPDADHRDTLFLIADDRRTLASRVRQLLSGTTWAENPRSRTRRLITNVRLLATDRGEARSLTISRSGVSSTSSPTFTWGNIGTSWCAAPAACCFARGGRCSISKPCARMASSASSYEPRALAQAYAR